MSRRGALSLPMTADTLVLQLLCTGGAPPVGENRQVHKRLRISTVSWADDGRGVVMHALHRGVPRATTGAVEVIDGEVDGREYGHQLLDESCPKCGRRYQVRGDTLRKMLDAVGQPGRVVDVDISKVL